ncbi:MAG: ketoacyl-ACP synthase III [Bacteroidota bacterium]|nr:ketoacyl-ACP synthase III [Bacteroidota bacterium]|tara:strand:- start:133 stop:1188 length:1056 start_codon:yes stop_codon:yes gene_type:complete
MGIKIIGSGSCIPEAIQENSKFINNSFYNPDGSEIDTPNTEIIEKFEKITGIKERRYADNDLDTSDLGYIAAKNAIEDACIDPETIDYIIVAHNFGNVKYNTDEIDVFPGLAVRIKNLLKIKNPQCVAYDILFGCPGWLEAVIQANSFIKSGMAKRCLAIGADTLSRVVDEYDRDSMIFADGAGATIIEDSDKEGGILSHKTESYTEDQLYYLFYGKSNKEISNNTRYIKMNGRKVYEFALTNVPKAIKMCIDEAGVKISDVKKILLHQANAKMDTAMGKRLYKLYDMEFNEDIMPLTVKYFGNSSVATIPTMFDLIRRKKLDSHVFNSGDIIIFASVGAGMHINAMVYQY